MFMALVTNPVHNCLFTNQKLRIKSDVESYKLRSPQPCSTHKTSVVHLKCNDTGLFQYKTA